MQHLTNDQTPTAVEILNDLNSLRKDNKNAWYSYNTIDSQGRTIEAKGFNTWLQIFRIDGIKDSMPMDISVKDFKSNILHALA